MKRRTLVLGLGNPILSDDRVGIVVARLLGERLTDVDFIEASIAGVSILDEIQGYSRLVVVDSIITGTREPGYLHRFVLEDLGPAVPAVSHHGVGLASTFEVGRLMGYDLPGEVEIYAIEATNTTEFGEDLSKAVEERLDDIVDAILKASFEA